MNDVRIGQFYDTYMLIYSIVCQQSNNEQMMSPKYTVLTLFLDDNGLI